MSEPDYQRFVETVESGVPLSINDMIYLALECGTPIPDEIKKTYLREVSQ